MAQPPVYNRSKDFTENTPDSTDHASLNAELDRASLSINSICTNLALIQGNDGRLLPDAVTIDAIDDSVIDYLAAGVRLELQPDFQQVSDAALLAEASATSAATSATQASDSAALCSQDRVTDIHYADVFNGYLYVAAEHDGTILHHYLQPEPEPGPEPEEEEAEEGEEKTEEEAAPSDESAEEETEEEEPVLPFVTQVTDESCPHTPAVLKLASKIFAVSPDGSTVRFSKTGDPTDWSDADDAGFLPTGLNARGDRATNALGIYANRLVALTRDGAQVWIADPDPSVMRLDEIVENVGTSYPQSLATVSGDLYFLSDFGFRSITTRQLMSKLADLDIGSPIDTLVRPVLKEAASLPKAAYFYGTGQYLCAIGKQVFVYSVSKSSGIAAWSRYELPFEVDAIAELDGVLYLRSADDVYQLSEEQHTDDGDEYEVVLQMAYLDFKSDGMLKRVYAIDLVMEGECYFSLGFDVRNPDAFTEEVRVIGNTRPGGLIPLDATGTEFSPRFRNKDGKPFQLNALTVYYEIQGPL